MKTETLLKVLQISISKHGPDKPVTLKHLSNLIALAMRIDSAAKEEEEEFLRKLAAECSDPNS